jgi:hypothetical protein
VPLSSEQRSQRARIGAYAQHARHDVRETTQTARDKFLQRFVDAVDPTRELPEPERQRRAAAALREHMARLALASSRARARK